MGMKNEKYEILLKTLYSVAILKRVDAVSRKSEGTDI